MIEKIQELFVNNDYKYGVYAKDLNGNQVKINTNDYFDGIGVAEIFVAVEYFKQLSLSRINKNDVIKITKHDVIKNQNTGIIKLLDYDDLNLTSYNLLILMLTRNDNYAFNKLIEYLGLCNINATIKELGFNTQIYNSIDFEKYKSVCKTTLEESVNLVEKLFKDDIYGGKKIFDILKKSRIEGMVSKALDDRDIFFRGSTESKLNYVAKKDSFIFWEKDDEHPYDIENVAFEIDYISNKHYSDYIVSIFISGFHVPSINYNCEIYELGSKIIKIVEEDLKKK